jgi:hypothetical protein
LAAGFLTSASRSAGPSPSALRAAAGDAASWPNPTPASTTAHPRICGGAAGAFVAPVIGAVILLLLIKLIRRV